MNCPKCGSNNNDGAVFCAECGAKMVEETTRVHIPVPPVPPGVPVPPFSSSIPVPPQPSAIPVPPVPARQEIPAEYKPLSAWAYVGWRLLFLIPFVGFVLLIVMSFAPRNKNLKSFARSYWCMALLGVLIAIIIVVIAVIAGVSLNELMRNLS